jgi:hypothetical protein
LIFQLKTVLLMYLQTRQPGKLPLIDKHELLEM